MAKIVFQPGRTNNARHTAVPTGHRLDVRNLLMRAWTAATFLGPRASRPLFFFFRDEGRNRRAGRPRSQSTATPIAIAQHRRRIFADPPALRDCLRCSKIECSTS
jgi:hypothetical protein